MHTCVKHCEIPFHFALPPGVLESACFPTALENDYVLRPFKFCQSDKSEIMSQCVLFCISFILNKDEGRFSLL